MATTHFDLIIVGGGMVGASLACTLQNTPLKIAVIEAFAINSDQQPSYDDRGIALAYGSQRIFEAMGLWSLLAPHSTAITNIHISDRGHFGITRLSAQDENVPALGQVITARSMGQVLNQALSQQNNLEMICPAKVTSLQQHTDSVELILNDDRCLSAKLIVAADGGNSTIRRLLGLGALEADYQQTAITANITPERQHQGRAFERFTDSGPIALLPMSDNRCSLVWTVKTGDEIDILELSDQDFLAQLQDRFGYRLGKLMQVGQRNSYPLKLMQADQAVQQRIVLIGNAAHSLHPIAGQGFNLGLRDVAALADVLATTNKDCGDAQLLHDYKQWRQQDQDNVINTTDALVKLFSNNNPLLGHIRGAGLTVMDAIPPAKHWLAQKSMGLARKQPRLGRGIAL
ncbi:MAG: 2-octaprenyl-6-methoxyphenyl hydroxylase [Gammaproteobacteria bacterium]|nr:MAG: 2-octaprenyl-6-methoxyphenyl hydroxylase [Gammaproteobacteria bacterium]RKZ95092.1 MAG: 2-octaprenyl-6-methoxyphenyl hydroxylase [Gammaproteobacteria bacterium]